MLFYKIEAQIRNMTKKELEAFREDREMSRYVQTKLTLFSETSSKDCMIFISSITKSELMMGAIAKEAELLDEKLPEFLSVISLECSDIRIDEVTLASFEALAEQSSHNDYIRSHRNLYEKLKLDDLVNSNYHELKYSEHLLPAEFSSKDELKKKAAKMLCQGGISPELERIFSPAKRIAAGHPVHYIIQSDDNETSEDIAKILLMGLYANGRIQSRRYNSITFKENQRWGGNYLDSYYAFYRSCESGAVVVNLIAELPDESDLVGGEMMTIEKVCQTALKYRNKALTIFRLPRAAERIKVALRQQLDTMTLVELTEDVVSADEAKSYLKQSAREHEVRPDKALYKDFKDELKTYSISELKTVFRHWYDNQLKTRCYTQYASLETAGRISAREKKVLGDAGKELDDMIGLEEAKKVINEAVNYFKAQKLFKVRGITESRPSMHMVFTGSPGTAKTTVARLFAQIMKDNGLLSVGGLFEVGRGDLVGKYVGWTAPTVQSKFREARGSVLFIDEAYSLVDDRDGLYGDEAISTVVQEMENQREDTVVIFAGYTDKMETFLQKNPGLRSRIAFHVPFADYAPDELIQILNLMVKKQKMKLHKDVADKLLPILCSAGKESDFGNGRYMRNLLERAKMKHAGRILEMDVDNVTKEELALLIAEDFEALPVGQKNISKIGF